MNFGPLDIMRSNGNKPNLYLNYCRESCPRLWSRRLGQSTMRLEGAQTSLSNPTTSSISWYSLLSWLFWHLRLETKSILY